MSATDYPDLTATPVEGVTELLPAARADLVEVLARSRRRPLPASPAGGAEPGHARLLLADLAEADPTTASPGSVPVGGPRDGAEPPVEVSAAAPAGALHELGVRALLAAFAAGRTRPSEVLAHLTPRWGTPEDPGPAPGAVLAIVPGAADAARESDLRWAEGTARPLEGVPFGVKDVIDVAGARVTSGSKLTGDRTAEADATAVARWRAAGAIPVVITATTEFACGAPANARYGAVSNPWDPTRWTGGSSTGSAAALAAGLVPLALGTDTGGSIRVPSAVCGLTGIKPTYGLVPRTGVAALSWTLDHVGPMARDAADLALVLPVLAGPDGLDPEAGPPAAAARVRRALTTAPAAGPSLDGLRVGLVRGWFEDLCDGAVLGARDSTAATLAALGAELVEVDMDDVELLHDDVGVVMTCELASNQEARLDGFADYDTGTQVRIARGLVPSAVDYLRALRRRPLAQRRVLSVWDAAGVDVALVPGVGGGAPRLSDATLEVDGQRHPLQGLIGRNTSVFDLLGFPAVMLPAGTVTAGERELPVGVQVVGRPWDDATCLRVASALQAGSAHHLRRPPPW